MDEIGYLPLSQGGANLFFQLVNARQVSSPGIWWIGFRMNRSGSDVHVLQLYS